MNLQTFCGIILLLIEHWMSIDSLRLNVQELKAESSDRRAKKISSRWFVVAQWNIESLSRSSECWSWTARKFLQFNSSLGIWKTRKIFFLLRSCEFADFFSVDAENFPIKIKKKFAMCKINRKKWIKRVTTLLRPQPGSVSLVVTTINRESHFHNYSTLGHFIWICHSTKRFSDN